MPVTGLTEAALASACLLGQRFSIVAISQRIRAWYRETVQANGLGRPAGQHPRASTSRWPTSARVQDDQARAPGRAGRALRRRGRRRRHRPRRRAAGRAGAQRCAAGCRCRWSTACRAPCATPRRWWRCSPAARARAASRRRPIKPQPRPAAGHRGAAAPSLTHRRPDVPLPTSPLSTRSPRNPGETAMKTAFPRRARRRTRPRRHAARPGAGPASSSRPSASRWPPA